MSGLKQRPGNLPTKPVKERVTCRFERDVNRENTAIAPSPGESCAIGGKDYSAEVSYHKQEQLAAESRIMTRTKKVNSE